MDFASPDVVLKALHDRIDHGIFGYTNAPDALLETVLGMLKTNYNWDVEPEWVIWLPGLVTGVNVTCRAVGHDNDTVMTNLPVYHPFLTAPKFSRRKLSTTQFVQTSGLWQFDFEDLEKIITPETNLFILCSPHNPAGRVFTREELLQLAEIADRHNMIICSDEIHCDLILDKDKRHLPTASLDPDIAHRTITLMAPSKTYNIPGLGCSFAIISNPTIRRRFEQTMSGIVPHVNVLGYEAALAAYRDGQAWLTALLDYLRGNRDLLMNRIEKMPGLSMTHVEATYLAWIDTRSTGIPDIHTRFEEAGVGLSDGKQFGGEGFVRFNFGCPKSILEKALDRMRSVLQ